MNQNNTHYSWLKATLPSSSSSSFVFQWRRYTRVRQVKLPVWKIHHPGSHPGSALPSPAYCLALVIVWIENKNVTLSEGYICFILMVKRHWQPVFWARQLKKGCQLPGDLAGGFSDLEMTWLFYCAGATTVVFTSVVQSTAMCPPWVRLYILLHVWCPHFKC